jgi:hypothetical protein
MNDPCLERTRAGVLNVLIASAAGIATSSFLLRWRDGWAPFNASVTQRRALMAALFVLTIVSYATRRVLIYQLRFGDPVSRPSRFFRAHVLAASLGTLAVPLGLAYGWLVRPRLDAVAPFWVVALALGFLAMPRARDFERLSDEANP